MRKQIMDKLRMAGQRINDFDKAYAARARQDMSPVEAYPLRNMLGGSGISEIGDLQADSAVERVLGEILMAGTKATNIGYRYGLPAAGLTLGAVGLEDIISGLYDGASQVPVMPGQLPVT